MHGDRVCDVSLDTALPKLPLTWAIPGSKQGPYAMSHAEDAMWKVIDHHVHNVYVHVTCMLHVTCTYAQCLYMHHVLHVYNYMHELHSVYACILHVYTCMYVTYVTCQYTHSFQSRSSISVEEVFAAQRHHSMASLLPQLPGAFLCHIHKGVNKKGLNETQLGRGGEGAEIKK